MFFLQYDNDKIQYVGNKIMFLLIFLLIRDCSLLIQANWCIGFCYSWGFAILIFVFLCIRLIPHIIIIHHGYIAEVFKLEVNKSRIPFPMYAKEAYHYVITSDSLRAVVWPRLLYIFKGLSLPYEYENRRNVAEANRNLCKILGD